MADAVTRRVLEIDAKIASGALQALKQVNSNVSALEKGFSSARATLSNFAAGLVSAFSVGAIVSGITQTIRGMDELNDQIQRLGVGAEEFQKLSYAAKLSGVSAEALSASIKKLSVNLQDVGTANTDAARALRALGVSAGDTVSQAFAKMADQFAKLPDGAQKTALAIQALGKSGSDLIPMLNGGAEGLAEMGDELERLGGLISGHTLRAAAEFSDQIDKLQTASRGAFAQIAEGLLPALTAITKSFSDAVQAGEGFTGVGRGIGEALIFITKIGQGVVAVFQSIGTALGALIAADQALLELEPGRALDIMKQGLADVDAIILKAGADMGKLDESFRKARVEMEKPLEPPKPQAARLAIEDTAGQKARRDAERDARRRTAADGAKAIEKEAQAWKSALDSLNESAASATLTLKLMGEGMPIEEAQQLAKAMVEFNLAGENLSKSQQARVDALKTGIATAAEAQRALNAEQERQNQLLKDAEALAKANTPTWEKQTEVIIEQAEAVKELGRTFEEDLLDAINGFSKEAAESLVDFMNGTEANFEDFAKNIARTIQVMVTQELITKPITKSITKFIEGFDFSSIFAGAAQGAAFERGGNVIPFRRGGIVSKPTMFAYGAGFGVMGERGAEAIMPLARTSTGELGVKASGNSSQVNNISLSIHVPPVTDRRTADQMAASVGIAVQRAMRRNE